MMNPNYSGVAYTFDYDHFFECSTIKAALSAYAFIVLNGIVVCSFINSIPVEDTGFKVNVDNTVES